MEYIIVFLIGLLVVGFILIAYVKQKASRTLKQMFNTDDIGQIIQQQKEEESTRAKSVSGMNDIYLPMIAKDFPQFNYQEFKVKSENMLASALQSLSEQQVSLLVNASSDLEKKIELEIEEHKQANTHEYYKNIDIHQTVISRYKKLKGTCVITLQTAVGYIHYIEKEGKMISGDKQYKEQTKYNVELMYVQDIDKLDDKQDSTFNIANCPNCGAKISDVGNKTCSYCGSAIEVVNIRVWHINDFTKVG